MLTRAAACIARLTVHRPWVLVVAALLMLAASAGVLATRSAFDTDILNLLPADRSAVQGLKISNTAFAQSRELTFVIQDPDPDVTAAFHAHLVERLRTAPWVVRLLDGPPIETAAGRADLQHLLVPLLLNLPADQFQAALENLTPEALSTRLTRLRRQFDAGSPAAALELETDPLGLLAAAARPLWQSAALNDSFAIRSPDGTTWMVPVITNQPTLGAEDCQTLMAEVQTFITQTLATFPREAPLQLSTKNSQLLTPTLQVTGRSAYVAEISVSMERDIKITSFVSLLAVTGLFWFAFRRLLPLLGIALLLSLSALGALALGSLLFLQLNVIAIGFCSILFGLGDDFGLLLYESYRHARASGSDRENAIARSIREMLPGILWVALTTAIGFLALGLSTSSGFGQLGTMVALGVSLCALLVPAFLFLFVRTPAPQATPPPFPIHHSPITIPFTLLLLALTVLAIIPFRPLQFDTAPTSLEPKNIPAARALQTILDAYPDSFEPVMVIAQSPDPTAARAQSVALDAHLQTLVDRGILARVASPTALILSPAQAETNRATIPAELPATILRETLAANDLAPEAFAPTFAALEQLTTARTTPPPTTWPDILPASSPWWFIIDRLLAPDGTTTATFLEPTAGYQSASSAPTLESEILTNNQQPITNNSLSVTGWTQTLGSLIPWAKQELLTFGGAVGAAILVILALVYREPRAWLIHALGLLFSAAATVATLKLLDLKINLLNVLAFPLMLAVGVDYGIHLILAVRKNHVHTVTRPVFISGLTTVAGFAALILASNPALNGLGTVCAIGVAWSLAIAFLFVLPTARHFLK